MKKLLLLYLLFIPALLTAQTRRQKKEAKRCDVLKYLPQQSDYNPKTFWNAITQNNKDFQDEVKSLEEGEGLAGDARREVLKNAYKFKIARQLHRTTEEEEKLCKDIRFIMLGDENSEMEFVISDDMEPNAYCTPDGYVCIYIGLIRALKGNLNLISGIIAHEITHYMYQHTLINKLNELRIKRGKSNEAALLVGGEIALGLPDKDERIKKIYERKEKEARFYAAQEIRDSEIQADVVAYRFLDWMGIDPANMANALRYSDMFGALHEENDEDDHPSTEFRLGVLSALTPAFYKEQQKE